MMIVARALLGVAGATLMPSTLALIRNLFHDPRERSLAIGIWAATASAGAAVGPLVGGALLEHFWWGSVFLINLPVMAVLVVVGLRLIPESKNPAPGPWDLPSVAGSLVGMIGVVYAVKETAAHGLHLDAAVAGVVGAAGLAWFVRRQLRLDAPLLDMRLFQHRGFSAAVLADLLTILGLAGLIFFLSQFLQLVQGRSPLQAGLAELPAALGAIGAGLVAGFVARRFSVRSAVSGGLAAVGSRAGRPDGPRPRDGLPAAGCLLLVVGIGAGLAFTVTADVILSSVPKEQAGAASAVSETAYELGAALGIAVLGSIVTGVYRGFPTPHGVPEPVAAAAHESLGGAVEAAAALPERSAARSSPRPRTPSCRACTSRPASGRPSCWPRPWRPGSCCAASGWRAARPNTRDAPAPGAGPGRVRRRTAGDRCRTVRTPAEFDTPRPGRTSPFGGASVSRPGQCAPFGGVRCLGRAVGGSLVGVRCLGRAVGGLSAGVRCLGRAVRGPLGGPPCPGRAARAPGRPGHAPGRGRRSQAGQPRPGRTVRAEGRTPRTGCGPPACLRDRATARPRDRAATRPSPWWRTCPRTPARTAA